MNICVIHICVLAHDSLFILKTSIFTCSWQGIQRNTSSTDQYFTDFLLYSQQESYLKNAIHGDYILYLTNSNEKNVNKLFLLQLTYLCEEPLIYFPATSLDINVTGIKTARSNAFSIRHPSKWLICLQN